MPGQDLVVTTDALVEGVHFRSADAADLIARKALRVNISDLAAKGATPFAYTLAAVLPQRVGEDWLEGFALGLAADQAEFAVHLIGGDSTATPGPITLSITALGRVPAGRALLRSTARPGDVVYVSGTIGDGALGLAVLEGEFAGLDAVHGAYLKDRYWLPRPRPGLGQALIGHARAAIDISDGLVADLGHIAETSHVGAEIHTDRIPLSAAARVVLAGRPAAIERVLTGGDDYELLFTAPPEAEQSIEAASKRAGVAVTAIGHIRGGDGVQALDGDGRPLRLTASGYRHF